MSLDPRFVINLKGKQFVLLAGLLDLAHQGGLKAIETEVLGEFCNPSEQRWVVRATATFRTADGEAVWSAVGDADPSNSQMRGAYLRHAETRGLARVLRFATNVGMTAAEELGGNDEETAPAANPARAARSGLARDAAPRAARPDAGADAAPAAPPSLPASFCVTCGVEVEEAVAQLAIKHFAAVYCVTHGRAELAAQRAAAERELVGVSEEE